MGELGWRVLAFMLQPVVWLCLLALLLSVKLAVRAATLRALRLRARLEVWGRPK